MADPVTVAAVASTVMNFAGGMMDASAQESAAKNQAAIYAAQARNAQAIADRNAQIISDQAAYTAKQQKAQAGQERAAAQRSAQQERLRRDLALSRARAVGASASGDTLDPTALNIGEDITEQGELNALNALFTGESAARAYETQSGLTLYEGKTNADMTRYEGDTYASLLDYQGASALARGKAAASSARLDAVSSLFSGGSEVYDKYSPTIDKWTSRTKRWMGTS